MDKENILYYQSNIKTSRDEDRVYAMKYANQQMLIDKLEQQCKKQKEVIDKAMKYIQKMFETGFYNDDYYLGHLKQILQDKEVSE